jgi:hypothetical protein
VFDEPLDVGLQAIRIGAHRLPDLVDFALRLDPQAHRILEPVGDRKEAAYAGEFYQFRIGELTLHLGKHVLTLARSIPGNVFRPQHRRAFPRSEVRRIEIITEADRGDLLVSDAGGLTKRRIVGNSVVAGIRVARLEDGHFLDPARKHAARALALQRRARQQEELGDVRNVGPGAGGVWHPAAEQRRRLEEPGNLPGRGSRIEQRHSHDVSQLLSGSLKGETMRHCERCEAIPLQAT